MKAIWAVPLLVIAMPAHGAQSAPAPSGMDCPARRLTPAQVRGITDLALEQAARDDPRAQPLFQVVEACGDELAWSPAKRRLAGLFTLATIAAAGTSELLGRRGVRIGELDQVILADRELMAAAETGRMDETVGTAFAVRHFALLQRLAAGQEMTGELGERIGHYIAFRAIIDVSARQFGSTP